MELTLAALISAALIDSINPCTLAIVAMLLAAIVVQKGRQKALYAGFLFTSIIFIMYFSMGLGILNFIQFAEIGQFFFYFMLILAVIMAIVEFNAYFNYSPGFSSLEMPNFLRPYAKKLLLTATSTKTIIIAAVGSALFLLPCSSGPYLVVIGLLAKAQTPYYLAYLILYNIIFVLPMVLITLLIYFGFSTAEKVLNFRKKYIKYLHLISGFLMLIVIAIIISYL